MRITKEEAVRCFKKQVGASLEKTVRKIAKQEKREIEKILETKDTRMRIYDLRYWAEDWGFYTNLEAMRILVLIAKEIFNNDDFDKYNYRYPNQYAKRVEYTLRPQAITWHLGEWDKQAYHKDDGFNIEGIHRHTGTEYDPDGYKANGHNDLGYDRSGYNLAWD